MDSAARRGGEGGGAYHVICGAALTPWAHTCQHIIGHTLRVNAAFSAVNERRSVPSLPSAAPHGFPAQQCKVPFHSSILWHLGCASEIRLQQQACGHATAATTVPGPSSSLCSRASGSSLSCAPSPAWTCYRSAASGLSGRPTPARQVSPLPHELSLTTLRFA